MLNISTESKNLYKQNRLPNVASLAEVHLFVEILDSNTVLTDDQIEQENFELEESICSEDELYFGLCESAMCKFAVYNVSESLIGKRIHVWQTIGDNAEVVSLGYFKISEETKRDGNTGLWKDIVAYDYLSEVLDTDVLAWWKTMWENVSYLSVGNIWKSLLTYLGISYTQMALANDTARVTNNINPSNLTARNVLQACGELSGVFGQMGRDGKFKWVSIYDASHTSMIYPSETLYPSTSLFPVQLSGASYGSSEELSGTNPIYFADQSQYEDYTVQPIDCVIVQNYDGALATKVGDTETNPYIVFGNFLTWGMSTSEQNLVASNLLAIIYGITYVPNVTSMIGLPYLECGDVIEIVLANDKTITTPIFQRVLTGIMNLTDAVTAQGTEYRTNKADSSKMTFAINAENAVTRVILEQTEDSILAEVSKTYATQESVKSSIEVSADSILLEVAAEYPNKDSVRSQIQVAVDGVSISGKTIDLTADNIEITSTNFKVDSDGNAKMNNLVATNGTFSGYIRATSGEFSGELKAATGTFSGTLSGADGTFSGTVSAGTITGTTITGGSIDINNGAFKVETNGAMSCSSASITGGTIHLTDNGENGNPFFKVSYGTSSAEVYSGVVKYSNGGTITGSSGLSGFYLRNATGPSVAWCTLDPMNLHVGHSSTYFEVNISNAQVNSTMQIYVGGKRVLVSGDNISVGAITATSAKVGGNDVLTTASTISIAIGASVNDMGPSSSNTFYTTTYIGGGTNGISYNRYHMQLNTGSDRRLKNFREINGNIERFYMDLKPIEYQYKPGVYGTEEVGRSHFGFIAQDIETSLEKAGITHDNTKLVYEEPAYEDFGMTQYVNKGDMVKYIDKGELHAFHVAMIQKQEQRIKELEGEIALIRQVLNI